MADVEGLGPAECDAHFLRRSFDVARRAIKNGNHPFGALLVGENGKVLIESENGYMPAHDGTAHAERLLATEACRTLPADVRAKATIYSSAEPCAMCAGAIYWAGIGRVVYGQTEKALKAQTGAHEENPTLDLPCDIVFAAGQRPTEVVGPLLEDEAAQLQAGFWKARG
jgi:tRNA(Arg) A34 adenosine deaminase TadA